MASEGARFPAGNDTKPNELPDDGWVMPDVDGRNLDEWRLVKLSLGREIGELKIKVRSNDYTQET